MDTGNHIESNRPGALTGFSEGMGSAGMHTSPYGAAYWDPKHGPGPRVLAASNLDGENVVNPAGDKLGDISEIMLDMPTGRIAYAVLSVGGFLGIGDKLLAIPWRALRLDPEHKRFVLNATAQQLKEAQGFDKEQWPSMADERWATELHNYYGADFYWR